LTTKPTRFPLLAAALLTCLFQALSAVHSEAQSTALLDSLNGVAKSLACRQVAKSDSISDYVIDAAKQNGNAVQGAYALKNKSSNRVCAGDFAVAIRDLKQVILVFKEYKDSKGEAEAYSGLTNAHRRLSQLDSAAMYNKLLYEIATDLNDSTLLMAAYQQKSGLHTLLSENDSVIFYAIKGLEIAEKLHDEKFEGTLLISVGNGYYQNEDFTQALEYYTKARQIFVKSNNLVNLNMIYHNIGTCYSKLKQPDSAFVNYEKAIASSKTLGARYNLAYNYQGIADAYFNVGDYQKAIEYNLQSKAISEELNEKRSLAAVLANLAACYTKINKPKQAIELANQAVTINKETGDLDKEADSHFLLSEAYAKAGDYKAALKSFASFYSIDSAILNKNKSETMFELETKYQAEKKELEIANLSQQASIKDLEIAQRDQALVIGLILMLIIAGLVYFTYRQRTLKNAQKQTALEQRFLRSQLNPHFISNALTAIQHFILQNQADKAAQYLAKFAKLMREILENSRQEFILVEDEVQMLTNYLDIHRVRMNESFDYKIDVDENINMATDTIPPMFVQPFVENAIEHGIINAKAKGLIRLHLIKVGDYISIEITDNGGGMQKKPEVKDHTSLSTTIIQERMALLNKSLKKKINLVWEDILTENGEVNGTKVELKVPYSYL
jgi:tetratricopeptide (TPR) repeat protein/two-component sensor histidine kinase